MIRVILCAHNGVRFLEAQLASIMAQEQPVDIVHVFDFASLDGTRELLAELAARWPALDVRLVAEAPGVVLSFFHAFAHIVPECGSHDVVFLSDQDDIWLPCKTRRMLACLASERARGHDHILAFHDVTLCDATLKPLRLSFYEGRPFRLPRDLARERVLIANPVIGHTMVLTRPLLALALRCIRPEFYAMHDWALVLLATHAGTIAYVPDRLGLYRQHDANILGAGRKRSMTDYVRRGIALSRSIGIQTAAFLKDIRCLSEGSAIADHAILPGRGPVTWRLGLNMARHGHTVGHRLMGFVQLARLWSASR